MKDKKAKTWRLLRTLAIALTLLAFTPVVIPQGKYRPELFGVPYSLWTTFLITIALVILTYFGTKVHRTDEEVKP